MRPIRIIISPSLQSILIIDDIRAHVAALILVARILAALSSELRQRLLVELAAVPSVQPDLVATLGKLLAADVGVQIIDRVVVVVLVRPADPLAGSFRGFRNGTGGSGRGDCEGRTGGGKEVVSCMLMRWWWITNYGKRAWCSYRVECRELPPTVFICSMEPTWWSQRGT
jgi:hypothetical protein